MLFAIVDTSGTAMELGLADENSLILAHRYPHTKENSKNIDQLFSKLFEGGESQHSLTHIVVGVGPGAFIGTRVGISFCNGFAVTRSLPVIPLGSMWGLAVDALLRGFQPIIIRSARRHSFYLGRYDDSLLASPKPQGSIEIEVDAASAVNFVESSLKSIDEGKSLAVYTDSRPLFDLLTEKLSSSRLWLFLNDSIVSIRGMAYLASSLISSGYGESFADAIYLRQPL